MHRRLIIDGKEIVINELGQPVDHAFDRLYEAYTSNVALPWQEFADAALQFFDANPTITPKHDEYFNNFTVIWNKLLSEGNYDRAEHVWELALQPAQQWEQVQPGRRVHKGTPYYFWAMTVLLRGDTDRGYLLIHQAVDEDIRSCGQQAALGLPGYALVSLNYQKVGQAFYQWVLQQAGFLAALLADYTATHGGNLTMDEVKHRFLDTPPNPETGFLFTYTLARLMNIARLPSTATTNQFAGQLEINLFFDITLVIEEVIKDRNPTKRQQNGNKLTFVHQGDYLLAEAGHPLNLLDATGQPLSSPQLRRINALFDNDFDATLLAALDGTLAVPPSPAFNRLQCDVALAYGIRNHAAHNTDAAPTIWNRFPEVQRAIFRVLFATIEHVY
jgi:hypothetical protein